MVFDTQQIDDAKFWHDKHVGAGSFCTDDVRDTLDKAKITGLRYRHFDQVSEAGRRLFAAYRRQRSSTNDGDRLRKYLAKFGLDWGETTADRS